MKIRCVTRHCKRFIALLMPFATCGEGAKFCTASQETCFYPHPPAVRLGVVFLGSKEEGILRISASFQKF